MSSLCVRCRSGQRSPGDTWCLACAAWEAIGRELSSTWSGPGGIRAIASDLAVNAAREIRALRALGAGLSRAPGSSVLVPSHGRAGTEAGDKTEVAAPAGVSAKSKPVEPEEESEYSYTDEEDEASTGRAPEKGAGTASGEKAEKGSTEGKGREDRGRSREKSKVKKEADSSQDRKRARGEKEREPLERRREGRQESSRKDERRDKDRRKKDKRQSKTKRGGRKHKRLYRLADDPYKEVHQGLSRSFLEERPGLDLRAPGKR